MIDGDETHNTRRSTDGGTTASSEGTFDPNSLLYDRPHRCRISSLLSRFQFHPASVFSSRTPRAGNLRETRQPAIITQLEALEPVRPSSAANKPPRLRLGKYSYQPIATFRNAPKAFPAKPHVEGFAPSQEKAVAAAAVVRKVQRNAHALGDATYGRDIFTNFWAETSVVDSNPWGGIRPSSTRIRRGRGLLEELIYFDNSALDSSRRGEGGGGGGGDDGSISSRTNNDGSEFGFDLETSRSSRMNEFDSEAEEEESAESGTESERMELPDSAEHFPEFSELLQGRTPRTNRRTQLPTSIYVRRVCDIGTQTLQQEDQEELQQREQRDQAMLDAEYEQWDRETSNRSTRGFIDIFSEFYGHNAPWRPQMTSTGTDTANFGESGNEDNNHDHEIDEGTSRREVHSGPWRNNTSASTATQSNTNGNDRLFPDSHARARSQVLDRIMRQQARFAGYFSEGTNNVAITVFPELPASYPRRQEEDDPLSFTDSELQGISDIGIPDFEESEDDDDFESSVFFQRTPFNPDLTPNSLFESFSEDLRSLAEGVGSFGGTQAIPDEFFFQDNYDDYRNRNSIGGRGDEKEEDGSKGDEEKD